MAILGNQINLRKNYSSINEKVGHKGLKFPKNVPILRYLRKKDFLLKNQAPPEYFKLRIFIVIFFLVRPLYIKKTFGDIDPPTSPHIAHS